MCGHQHEEHYLDVRGAPCGICACFAFRPAAVSAPAGEATPLTADVLPGIPPAEQVARLITDLLEFSASERPDDPVRAFAQMEVAKLRAHQAARVLATFCSPVGNYGHRSPAPASGAPDARHVPLWECPVCHTFCGAAIYYCDGPEEPHEPVFLAALLAAAERAGEAMREALLGDDPEMPPALRPLDTIAAAVELARAFVYGDRSEFDEDPMATSDTVDDAVTAIANLRAVLTPTSPAPSPEEER